MGFNYLFIFPPGYVALWCSKACHRLASESVSWCLETSLFFKTPFPGRSSILPLWSLFYIFSYLLSKTIGHFSGCLMSSASFQKLFCGIYSVFKCSFDEFVGEKVVSPSYSSTILGPLPASFLPMNVQGWFPLGLTGSILQCKGLSRVFSNITVQKRQFLGPQPSLWSHPLANAGNARDSG